MGLKAGIVGLPLDKSNSILVMEELKKRSKSSLVVLVTHNQKLAKEYHILEAKKEVVIIKMF